MIAFYILTHKPTGVFYVGSTKNLRTRLIDHRVKLDGGKHYAKALQDVYRSWDEISVEHTECRDDAAALRMEQDALKKYHGHRLCANRRRGATAGAVISDEGRERLAAGRRGTLASDETRQLMSDRRRGVSRPRSEEGARAFSEKMQGRTLSEEHKANVSAAKKGVPKSEEQKQRLVEAGLATARQVSIEGVVYRSVKFASEQLGINQRTLVRRLENEKYADWHYV